MTEEELEAEIAKVEENEKRMRTLTTELRHRINMLDPARERSLALTKLDECELWLTRCMQTLKGPADG